MQLPGRDELRKMYEDLADEVLLDIAQNIKEEYENVAVEVARNELDKRGVDIQLSVKEESGTLNQSGKNLEGPLVEIPGFSAEESLAIDEIFTENNIPFEKQAVTSVSCSGCGCEEYAYYVERRSFTPAVELLKEYFMAGIEMESSNCFSGECPACGTDLMNVEKCTDCGLTLALDNSQLLEKHSFILFLKRHNLLS